MSKSIWAQRRAYTFLIYIDFIMDEKINIAGVLRRPDGIAMANVTMTVTSVSN